MTWRSQICRAPAVMTVRGPSELLILESFAARIEQHLNQSPTIFISYSHEDEVWKDRLVRHLGVLKNQDLLDFWVDRSMEAGAAWREEIRDAMEASNVAILLVSTHFLTSRFILDGATSKTMKSPESREARF